MLVTIVVPVRNEAANIRRTIAGLAKQNLPVDEYEILVVDGLSDDSTPRIIHDLQKLISNLRLFHNPKRLASSARNIGVRHARGEYIVVVDGHCCVRDTHFLSNLVEAFETSGADSLGRPQPLRSDEPTSFQRTVAAARTSWLGHNPDSAIYSNVARFVPADNVAAAYRRDVFDLMGGFDESFDACEDVEFNTRFRQVGLTCYFTPSVAVEYQPRGSLRGLAYQMMRYGRGRARLGRKHPTTIGAASLVAPLWLVWLTFGGLVGLLWWPVGLAVLASLAMYLLVLMAESVRIWRSESGVSLRRLPLVLAGIHVGFGWGYLREVVSGPNRLAAGSGIL